MKASRCKGSELSYFDMQFSWQVQLIVEGSDFVTGAVNRHVARCRLRGRHSTLCDPRCADFVAGATLGEPRSADFVTW